MNHSNELIYFYFNNKINTSNSTNECEALLLLCHFIKDKRFGTATLFFLNSSRIQTFSFFVVVLHSIIHILILFSCIYRSTSRYADLEKPKKKKTLSATTSLVSIPNTIKLSMLNSGLLSFGEFYRSIISIELLFVRCHFCHVFFCCCFSSFVMVVIGIVRILWWIHTLMLLVDELDEPMSWNWNWKCQRFISIVAKFNVSVSCFCQLPDLLCISLKLRLPRFLSRICQRFSSTMPIHLFILLSFNKMIFEKFNRFSISHSVATMMTK